MDVKPVIGVDLYSHLSDDRKRQLNDMREKMKTVRACSPVKNSAFDEMMKNELEKAKKKLSL